MHTCSLVRGEDITANLAFAFSTSWPRPHPGSLCSARTFASVFLCIRTHIYAIRNRIILHVCLNGGILYTLFLDLFFSLNQMSSRSSYAYT